MAKKLTIDDARKSFEERNYILLDNIYINNSTKMRYKCKIHSDIVQEISLGNLKNGKGCKCCRKEKASESRRKTNDEIIIEVADRNCEIIDIENYENRNSVLTFKCSKGHTFKKAYCDFLKAKHICKECDNIVPLTNERVKEYIASQGYRLIDDFIDYNIKIYVECEKGHRYHVKWSNFQQGQRCPTCQGNKKYTFEEVKDIFTKNNCELLSKEYINVHEKLNYICECENKSSITLKSFLEGRRCNICRYKKSSVNRVKTLYKNGTAPISKQQDYIFNIIGGELNYPFSKYSLDIAFPQDKIYVEYDGGGHDLQVKKGDKTKEEFERYEMIRSRTLRINGWKEVRIISNNDILPNEDIVKDMLAFAKKHISTGRSWIKFDVDNGMVISNSINKLYNYGSLKKIS